LYLIIDLYVVVVNSFSTAFVMLHAHTNDISTYSVITDSVSDSSLQLRCLGFPYMLRVCTLIIHRSMQHANAV